MALPAVCQTTLTGNIESIVNKKGDTLIVMNLNDAKLILADLLDAEVTDSLLNVYIERDELNSEKIVLKDSIISKLKMQNENNETIIKNLNKIIENKNKEIGFKDEIIEGQKKEIKKQKTLKILGFSGAIALPILTLVLLL